MAVLDLAAIAAALNLKYNEQIARQYRRDVVLANLIETEPDSNQNCTWRVKIAARDTAGPRAEGYTVDRSTDMSTDLRKQAILPWAHYEAYASVTGTAERIAAANGALGESDQIGEELQDALEEVTAVIGSDVYAGDYTASPVEIAGLSQAVDSTGTYANLAQGTYASWASGEDTLAYNDLSLDNIRTKLLRPFRDAVGKNPDAVLCTGAVMDKVAALYDNVLLATYIASPMGPDGQVNVAKLGFRAYNVEGVPFIEDRHATADTMFALDLGALKFKQIPAAWSSMDPGQLQGMIKSLANQTVEITDIQAAQKFARTNLSFQINALAKNGDSTALQLVNDFQLRLRRRNAASKLHLT